MYLPLLSRGLLSEPTLISKSPKKNNQTERKNGINKERNGVSNESNNIDHIYEDIQKIGKLGIIIFFVGLCMVYPFLHFVGSIIKINSIDIIGIGVACAGLGIWGGVNILSQRLNSQIKPSETS